MDMEKPSAPPLGFLVLSSASSAISIGPSLTSLEQHFVLLALFRCLNRLSLSSTVLEISPIRGPRSVAL